MADPARAIATEHPDDIVPLLTGIHLAPTVEPSPWNYHEELRHTN